MSEDALESGMGPAADGHWSRTWRSPVARRSIVQTNLSDPEKYPRLDAEHGGFID
jgi:hypothetical protein